MKMDTERYFERLNQGVSKAYDIATAARSRGFDPVNGVEVFLAKNMAERIEGLIKSIAPQIKGCGLVERIGVLEKKYKKLDWRVAFVISLEVAQEKFCKFKNKKEAMEIGLRVGLAYLTNGVVASPLEGFTRLELKKRKDGKGEYFCLYFAGPIRSAGTTAMCAFVGLADYVRHEMGYTVYDPTKEEIKRVITEVYDFHDRITNLQYLPYTEELEYMAKTLPVQIDGEPTEKLEVSNYKDLDRIETNRIRNGVCLVFGEGLTQKAKKFWGIFSQWYNDFDMEYWNFIEGFLNIQAKMRAREKKVKKKEEEGAEEKLIEETSKERRERERDEEGELRKEGERGEEKEKNIEWKKKWKKEESGKSEEKREEREKKKIKPDFNYIKDIVAGRPVLGHPLRVGGFRLRYGRARNGGLSSCAIHPATMVILDDYIAV